MVNRADVGRAGRTSQWQVICWGWSNGSSCPVEFCTTPASRPQKTNYPHLFLCLFNSMLLFATLLTKSCQTDCHWMSLWKTFWVLMVALPIRPLSKNKAKYWFLYVPFCSETDKHLSAYSSLHFFLSLSLYLTFDLFASLFVFVIWRDVNLATPRESILTSDTKKTGKKKGEKNQNNISHKKWGGWEGKSKGGIVVWEIGRSGGGNREQEREVWDAQDSVNSRRGGWKINAA